MIASATVRIVDGSREHVVSGRAAVRSGGATALTALLLSLPPLLVTGCATDLTREQLATEYYNLGTGYLESDDAERAVRYLRRALELQPEAANVRLNLAAALLETGDTDAASIHLDRLLAADPDNLQVLELQAASHQRGGRWGSALAVYRTLLELQPQHATARFNSAILSWKMGARADAATDLRVLLADHPDDQEARYHLALLVAQEGRVDEAATLLRDYLETRPDDGEALLALARVEHELRRYDAALELYAEAEPLLPESDPRRADLQFERAAILLTAVEDPIEGLAALRTALQRGFDDRQRLADLLAADNLLYRPMVVDLVAEHAVSDQSQP